MRSDGDRDSRNVGLASDGVTPTSSIGERLSGRSEVRNGVITIYELALVLVSSMFVETVVCELFDVGLRRLGQSFACGSSEGFRRPEVKASEIEVEGRLGESRKGGV